VELNSGRYYLPLVDRFVVKEEVAPNLNIIQVIDLISSLWNCIPADAIFHCLQKIGIVVPWIPSISVDEANLTAHLHLLGAITITEFPTNGATLQVEDVLTRLRTGITLP
jgi:hypothetical protein